MVVSWWSTLPFLEQIFFLIALPATAVLLIQTLLLLFGGMLGGAEADADASGLDADTDVDTDSGAHHDSPDGADAGLRILTVRGVMAFLTVSGWTGVVLMELHMPESVCIVVSLLLGGAALFAMAWLVRALLVLQEDGSVDIRSAIGQEGVVYLTVPPTGRGQGKIMVRVGEALREGDAVTNSTESIPTGASIRVTEVLEDDVFVVEPQPKAT